jgi:glutamate transport system permease protein
MSVRPAAVLFDVPGPQSRRRYRIYGLIGIVLVALVLLWLGKRLKDTGQFNAAKWDVFTYEQVRHDLLAGLRNTLKAFALGSALALGFGTVFAAGRLSDHAWIRRPAIVVVELFRAIPLVIMIFLIYYGFTDAKEKLWSLALGLMLYNGSVLAEVFRAGVNAVPRGQREAAFALGMRKSQVMVTILLPQALRTMLPSIVSQLVVLLKDTALGFLIVYDELLDQGKDLFDDFQFQRPVIPVSIVIAVIYIIMCALLSLLAWLLDRRLRRSPKTADIPAAAHDELDVLGAQE